MFSLGSKLKIRWYLNELWGKRLLGIRGYISEKREFVNIRLILFGN